MIGVEFMQGGQVIEITWPSGNYVRNVAMKIIIQEVPLVKFPEMTVTLINIDFV